jgi:hypothetical protein
MLKRKKQSSIIKRSIIYRKIGSKGTAQYKKLKQMHINISIISSSNVQLSVLG